MKIALIITCLELGGAERQAVNLADALAARGHEVLIISLTGEPELRPARHAVRVESLRLAKTPASALRAFWQAARLLRRFAPDVVHSHMFHANLFARLLRLIAPVPRLICSVHTISEAGLLRMRLYRSTDALADVTTMVSREVAQRYVGSGAVTVHKALVAHNGIDCDAFRFDPLLRAATRAAMGAAPHIRVLLAAGRICEDKDYPNLLHAFAAVTQRHADCVLWIAGDGPGKPALEAMARGLGVAGRVRFLGMRRDMQALMNAADVFVMSSCVEGFPLVIGEAMACERPVVSTAASGVHEWLGCCGAIAPMRDSMALAGAVSQALEHDAATLQRQGQAQRRRILERYSLEATVLRWEAIYRGDFGAVSS